MNSMNHLRTAIIAGIVLLSTATLGAADAKSYQVTGPVLEVTDTTITVQKGDEKWQLARTKGTKIAGDLKVGSKVTVYYQMVATDVEVKADKPAKKDK